MVSTAGPLSTAITALSGNAKRLTTCTPRPTAAAKPGDPGEWREKTGMRSCRPVHTSIPDEIGACDRRASGGTEGLHLRKSLVTQSPQDSIYGSPGIIP